MRGAASKDTLKSRCEADPLPLSTFLPKFFACSSRQECLVSSSWPLGLLKPQSLPVWFFSLFPTPGQGEAVRLCHQQGPLFARSSRPATTAARASHGTSGPTRQVPRAPSRASAGNEHCPGSTQSTRASLQRVLERFLRYSLPGDFEREAEEPRTHKCASQRSVQHLFLPCHRHPGHHPSDSRLLGSCLLPG